MYNGSRYEQHILRKSKRALDKVAELKAKTKEIYPDLELPHVPVSFNLRGQTAGMVRYRGGKIKDLRLNLDILNNPKHTTTSSRKRFPMSGRTLSSE